MRLNPNVAAVYSNLAGSLLGLDRYQFGDIRLDFRRAEAYRGQDVVELSAKEFKLLVALRISHHLFAQPQGDLSVLPVDPTPRQASW